MEFFIIDHWEESEPRKTPAKKPTKAKAKVKVEAVVSAGATTSSSRGVLKPAGFIGAVIEAGSVMVGAGLRVLGVGLAIWGGLSVIRWALGGVREVSSSVLGRRSGSVGLAA